VVRSEKYKSAGAGADGQPLLPPRAVANLPQFITNQIPSNLVVGGSSDCSEAFIGKWDEMLVGASRHRAWRAMRSKRCKS
jgi:hypothetical protein